MRLVPDALVLAWALAWVLAVDGFSDGSGNGSWISCTRIQRTRLSKLIPKAPPSSQWGQPIQLRWIARKQTRSKDDADDEDDNAKAANSADACINARNILPCAGPAFPQDSPGILLSLRDSTSPAVIPWVGLSFHLAPFHSAPVYPGLSLSVILGSISIDGQAVPVFSIEVIRLQSGPGLAYLSHDEALLSNSPRSSPRGRQPLFLTCNTLI